MCEVDLPVKDYSWILGALKAEEEVNSFLPGACEQLHIFHLFSFPFLLEFAKYSGSRFSYYPFDPAIASVTVDIQSHFAVHGSL